MSEEKPIQTHMTIKEIAAAYPIGADSDRTWRRWINDWIDDNTLYVPAHCAFTSVPGHNGPVRTYSVKTLLRLAYNEGRDHTAAILKQQFHVMYASHIRSLFNASNGKDSHTQQLPTTVDN